MDPLVSERVDTNRPPYGAAADEHEVVSPVRAGRERR